MADSLYLLTLKMTEKVVKVMNEEEKKMVDTTAFFVFIYYGPWFLKSYVVQNSTNNDLAAFKSAFHIRDQYPNLGQALLSSMQRHSWYLTGQLVMLAIADDDVEEAEKLKMLEKMLQYDVPDQFRLGKPELPIISRSTELTELVTPESWILLKVAEVADGDVEKWVKGEASDSYEKFQCFIKNNICVNDCAERNIRLIQDFVDSYISEDMKQNVMLVARDNRKKLKKDMSKSQLGSI